MLRPTILLATLGSFFALFVTSCGEDTIGMPTQTNTDMPGSMGDPMNTDSDTSMSGMDAGVSVRGDELTTRVDLLKSIATHVYSSTYVAFHASAESLEAAILAWSEDPSPDNTDTAQAAWRASMAIWQRAELMQVGPAGTQGRRVGGEDGRDRIYSFPTTNPCRVDQELVAERYAADAFTQNAQLMVRGLDALEYLLFNDTDENACPSVVTINRSGEWTAMVASEDGELHRRRAAMAQVIMGMLLNDAQELVDAWAEDGTFRAALTNGSEPYETTKQALDQVYAGMFYLDKAVKDLKLAKPAGLSMDCESDTCPDAVESRFANISKENLINNMIGFKHIFEGGEDDSYVGFDDILEAEGAGDLAVSMRNKLDTTIAALENIDGTLKNAVIENHGQVQAAYDAVKTLNDDLKTQFVTTLGLSVPQEGAGDND